MSCSKWELDISAFVDGCLDEKRSSELEAHLQRCPGCASLVEELQQADNFVVAAYPELTPPPALWWKLEAQIRKASMPVQSKRAWWRRLELPKLPRYSYGIATILVLALLLVTALDLRETTPTENQYLAELDAYTLESEGNPFLPTMGSDNPFFVYQGVPAQNPFGGGRSVEK